MTDMLAQWFGIVGIDTVPPQTLSELVPYLLRVAVGIGLTVGILRIFRAVAMAIVTRNPRL